MDNNINIKLFNTDENNIAMPSVGNDDIKEQSSLMSESIDKAILGSQVKTLILPEDLDIYPTNYIFDFTDLQSINAIQKEALKSIVSLNGNVQLYIYKKSSGLMGFGMGEQYSLERMIPLIKQFVFENKIKVYKNFEKDKPLIEVVSRDITKMRLNL
ncbi:MAG: hypothetical protein J6A59_01395 [Lachnospiraceae bacterium]|nr:hypothetical protein [Lachnospiraceae bacterium]